jgi:hypothetical protein
LRRRLTPTLESLESRLTPGSVLTDAALAAFNDSLIGKLFDSMGVVPAAGLPGAGDASLWAAPGTPGGSDSGGGADALRLEEVVPAGQTAGVPLAGAEVAAGTITVYGGRPQGFTGEVFRQDLGQGFDPLGASPFGDEPGLPQGAGGLQQLRNVESQISQIASNTGAARSAGEPGGLGITPVFAAPPGVRTSGAIPVPVNVLPVKPIGAAPTARDAMPPSLAHPGQPSGSEAIGVEAPPTGSAGSGAVQVVLQAPEFVGRSFGPVQLQVQASSYNPYTFDRMVRIDVDLKHDGTFTDPGDQDYAVAPYYGGTATVTLDNPLPEGTYDLRARVRDLAGNETTSAVVTMQIDPNAGFIGSQALLDLAQGLPYGESGMTGPIFKHEFPDAAPPPALPGATGPLVGTPTTGLDSLLNFDGDGRVLVNVRVTQAKYLDDMKAALTDLGMQVIGTAPAQNLVIGYVSTDQILALQTLPHFSTATPVWKPVRRTGPVTGQGNAVIKADVFRASQGVDGTGVKVGVLSDSVNRVQGPGSLTGVAASVAFGTLPSTGVEVLKDDTKSSDTDEGRAMLEIVHDVAPGAPLAFYTAAVDPTDFAAGIAALANAGAKVEVDDIGYPNSPMFNDGVIAQAADAAVARGVFYASAAGNQGNEGWVGDWNGISATVGTISGTFENFGGGSPYQNFNLPSGGHMVLSLDWDSAFLEGGSALANFQVSNEIDAYVVDRTTNTILKTFNTNTLNTDEAFQLIDYTNNGTTGSDQLAMAFRLAQGSAPRHLRWASFIDDDPMAVGEGAPTTFGQPAARGAVAVGAVDWRTPTVAESFTAQGGPLTFYFDAAGNRLATPEVRQKPEVAAPDGVFTSFFGNVQGSDPFPSFFGTSAAAPHVAGAAALLLQQRPGTSPATLTQHLERTARDVAAPGFDNLTGFGLIQLVPLPVSPLGPPGSGPGTHVLSTSDIYDPNETSDRAVDFGRLAKADGTQELQNLTIANEGNLPNIDWFRWTPSESGTFTAVETTTLGGDLELHLFVLQGNTPVEVARDVSTGRPVKTLSIAVNAGVPVLVEAKGRNSSLGHWDQGTYTLDVTLT